MVAKEVGRTQNFLEPFSLPRIQADLRDSSKELFVLPSITRRIIRAGRTNQEMIARSPRGTVLIAETRVEVAPLEPIDPLDIDTLEQFRIKNLGDLIQFSPHSSRRFHIYSNPVYDASNNFWGSQATINLGSLSFVEKAGVMKVPTGEPEVSEERPAVRSLVIDLFPRPEAAKMAFHYFRKDFENQAIQMPEDITKVLDRVGHQRAIPVELLQGFDRFTQDFYQSK